MQDGFFLTCSTIGIVEKMNTSTIDLDRQSLSFQHCPILMFRDNALNFWFKGVDICKCIGTSQNSHRALQKYVPDHSKVPFSAFGISHQHHQPHTIFINEEGLFRLVLHFKTARARELQDWVYGKLPIALKKYREDTLSQRWKDVRAIQDQEIQTLRQQIEDMRKDYTPQTKNQSRRGRLMILKKTHESLYPFYAIRTQRCSTMARLSQLNRQYPGIAIFADFHSVPNAVNLFNLMREKGLIEGKGNHFKTPLSDPELKAHLNGYL